MICSLYLFLVSCTFLCHGNTHFRVLHYRLIYLAVLRSDIPAAVQKAFRANYNSPYLDTARYYIKGQTPKHLLYMYDVDENNRAIVPSLVSTTKLKAEMPWWQPAKLPQLTPYTVISPTSSHRPLKAYALRYTYNYIPATSSRLSSPFFDAKKSLRPLRPISITGIETPNKLDNLEVTTANVLSTAPVIFPSTPSPLPKKHHSWESLLKYYTTTKDMRSYFLSKDTIKMVETAIQTIREQNPHLDITPKGIKNNELIFRVIPSSEYLIQSTAQSVQPDSDAHVHLSNVNPGGNREVIIVHSNRF